MKLSGEREIPGLSTEDVWRCRGGGVAVSVGGDAVGVNA